MLIHLTEIARRNAGTLLEDAAGCVALLVVLYVGLVLPGLV